jgi:hypothetical protein
MTQILAPVRFASRMKAKGKTHVCFPNRYLFQLGAALQAPSPKPLLTFIIRGCKCVLSCVF